MSRGGWFLLALVLWPSLAAADLAAEHYNRGNQLYAQGQYAEALEAYQAAYDAGGDDADLYLNLGNAAMQARRIGLAVWAYEKGLRLAPRDRDLRANLAFAEKNTLDELPEIDHAFLWRAGGWWVRLFSLTEGLIVAVTAWALAWAMVLLWQPLRRRRVWLALVAGICLAVFLISVPVAAWRLYDQTVRRRAGVVADEAVVRQAPADDAPEAFVVHAGLRLEIVEIRDTFARVRVPTGVDRGDGWMHAAAFRRLDP